MCNCIYELKMEWDMDLLYSQRRNRKAPSKSITQGSYLAEWTGLEPATPGVTGRYSNQLNYHSW